MLYYYCLVFILQDIFLNEKATLTGLLFLIMCYDKYEGFGSLAVIKLQYVRKTTYVVVFLLLFS